jgi:hypothetical protein
MAFTVKILLGGHPIIWRHDTPLPRARKVDAGLRPAP